MLKVLAFGNTLHQEDKVAIDIARELTIPGVVFSECHSLDQALQAARGDTIILDVARGIDRVMLIDDLDRIKARHLYSLHDFDLGYFLKLMQSMGSLDSVRILALPYGRASHEVIDEVAQVLRSLVE